MRVRLPVTILALSIAGTLAAMTQAPRHLNPVVDLLAAKKPVFGLYAPSNRRFPPRPAGAAGAPGAPGGAMPTSGAPTAPAEPAKSPTQLAAEAMADSRSDYIFDGTMEGDFDRAIPAFGEFMKGMGAPMTVSKDATRPLSHPVFVKTHEIAPDPKLAAERIGRQLDLGVTGVVFVGVESAGEVRQGLAAMRFKSNGGTRPDAVGGAPAVWGMSEKEYRAKADVWPLNPKGELVNFTIVESKEGLAHVREIAAVKGIGVLFPGAGTLRGVFSTTDASGARKLDAEGWEAAIQQVLAACKEFNVPCGYPATENDIELRMKQGFSVFVINWGEPGFRAVDLGRKVAGR